MPGGGERGSRSDSTLTWNGGSLCRPYVNNLVRWMNGRSRRMTERLRAAIGREIQKQPISLPRESNKSPIF